MIKSDFVFLFRYALLGFAFILGFGLVAGHGFTLDGLKVTLLYFTAFFISFLVMHRLLAQKILQSSTRKEALKNTAWVSLSVPALTALLITLGILIPDTLKNKAAFDLPRLGGLLLYVGGFTLWGVIVALPATIISGYLLFTGLVRRNQL